MPIPPQGSIHCCRSKKSGDLVFIGSPLFVFIGCALRNMVKNSLRFWRSWLHLQRCCIIFSMTIIKRNNRPSVQLGGYFITILVGADRFRCALSIFIIRIFLRFVKGQTGVFFGYAVLTIFGRVCYNKALGHTENGGRFRFLLPRIYIRWEVMLWNIMWLGQSSLRFWHSWLHLQLCCIIFSMTIIKRNNRPSCNCGGYFF